MQELRLSLVTSSPQPILRYYRTFMAIRLTIQKFVTNPSRPKKKKIFSLDGGRTR